MTSPWRAQPIASADNPIDLTCVTTMRTLAMDAVQQANSGHPGTPMSMAPVAYALWQNVLRFDPERPDWPNRDRFVLSAGHASMLLYNLLFLSGVKQLGPDGTPTGEFAVTLDEIKRFRQLDSRTPGHPESHITSGVETTTGPLGQGAANSVGMAIAERWLAARYNQPGFEGLVDFNVFALCGDGCMMEGITSEAASLAGHLKLSNLCWIYDNNHITIEGKTSLAFSEDVGARFKAYGWNVLHVTDANDLGALTRAYQAFLDTHDRPTFLIVDSHIGYGAPHKQDTKEAHGEPLGAEEIKLTKRFYGWPEDAKFLVPDGVRERFQEGVGQRGKALRGEWSKLFERYKAAHPGLALELELMWRGGLPEGWDKDLPSFPADPKGDATRNSSGAVLNAIAKNVPWLIGGAADLAPSTKTLIKDRAGFATGNYEGGNFHFGVREHAMGGILNGMALTKLRPYGAGFLIFTDYGRGSIRLAALIGAPVIYIMTHDSIGVGEDGPTHQPIEQIPSLRAIPHLKVIRPCDSNEVVEAWRVIMNLKHEPVVLALTRQNLPTLDRARYAPAAGLARGGYVLADAPGGKPDVILIGTGSEVSFCVEAHETLTSEGINSRVVSMPCTELFDAQDQAYRDQVLPPGIRARVSIEAAAVQGWHKYVGLDGTAIGMPTFGASAPYKDVYKKYDLNPGRVVAEARKLLKQ